MLRWNVFAGWNFSKVSMLFSILKCDRFSHIYGSRFRVLAVNQETPTPGQPIGKPGSSPKMRNGPMIGAEDMDRNDLPGRRTAVGQDGPIDSKKLFGESKTVRIYHDGNIYHLKITRQGKLILNK